MTAGQARKNDDRRLRLELSLQININSERIELVIDPRGGADYISCVENRRVTTAVRESLLGERPAPCALMSSAARASVPTSVLPGP